MSQNTLPTSDTTRNVTAEPGTTFASQSLLWSLPFHPMQPQWTSLHSRASLSLAGIHHPIAVMPHLPTFLTFEDYVQSLPGWDLFLIKNVLLLDLDGLLEHILITNPLTFCSDGGAVTTFKSYGSIIATDNTILTETCRQAYGHTPLSFRAEGYGFLGNLHLISHLLLFFELPFTSPPITVVSDNKGLLKRLRDVFHAKLKHFST
jgi:hypothetical protein